MQREQVSALLPFFFKDCSSAGTPVDQSSAILNGGKSDCSFNLYATNGMRKISSDTAFA